MRKAGINPNSKPAAIDTSAVNRMTRGAIPMLKSIGTMIGGCTASSPRSAIVATRAASSPPSTDSTALSVSIWRIKRPRPAPIARRTAISCRRTEARASIMLAMLAQAISSTRATITINTPAVRTHHLIGGRVDAYIASSQHGDPAVGIGVGILRRQVGADGANLRVGLFNRGSGPQAPDHVGVV